MIYIYDKDNNIYISLNGNIEEELNKRGYNEIMSTRGIYYQEHIRGVVNIKIEITDLSVEDYNKLKLVFLNSKSNLYVEDDDTGTVYSKYYIKGDILTLTKNEDVENKRYYYKGSITLNKR